MASFSVDITSVRFAATHSGYKDITIIGMPQAGVNCTITGTNPSSFAYRIPGDDQNVYRVYTTNYVNTSSSSSLKSAIFKIANASDSSDYITVNLVQEEYNGYTIVRDAFTKYSNIYVKGRSGGYFEATSSSLLSNIELYVDGYTSAPTVSENWVSCTVQTTFSDTGFKRVLVSCNNNYGSYRVCNISFSIISTYYIYQNGNSSASSNVVYPSPLTFTNSGGTQRVTLKHSAGTIVYMVLENKSSIDYNISKVSGETSTKTEYDITLAQNNSDVSKSMLVQFGYQTNTTDSYSPFGFVIINQDSIYGPADTLTVDPVVLDYPASGGARVMDVTYATSLSTNESSFPSWLSSAYVSTGSGIGSYTITAASNTSTSGRDFNFDLSDANMSIGVPITQAGSSSASLSISPTAGSVSSSSGSVQITVTSSGISDVQYIVSDSWITYGGKSGNVYTFNYAAKSTTGQRIGSITFYGGGLSETYKLVQSANQVLSVIPTKMVCNGGPFSSYINREFKVYYASGHSYNDITITTGVSWLTRDANNDKDYGTYCIFYFKILQNNSGSDRYATIVFSDGDSSVEAQFKQSKTITNSPYEIWPDTINFGEEGGTETVAIMASGGERIVAPNWISYEFPYQGEAYIGYDNINIKTLENTGTERTGEVQFYYGQDYTTLLGKITVNQEGSSGPSPEIMVSPASASVGSSSGMVVVQISGPSLSSVSYSISQDAQDWITVTSNMGVYNISYEENTGSSERTGVVTFSADGYVASTYTLTQAGSSGPSPVITVSPASASVSSTFGVVDVTATGSDNITHSISQGSDWITYRGKTGDVFSFDYTSNTSTSSRTGVITFSASGAISGTYTLVQAGENPGPGPVPVDQKSLKAYPKKLRYYCEGGGKRVSFINRPENGIGYEITYIDGSGWLSVSNSGSEKVVTATANSGIRRRASIKFYDLGNSENYVIVPVIQGSIYFYSSIWMDELYYPADRDEDGNYYYRITDQDTEKNYFIGVSTIPPGWQGNVGGIDVPRLVESYLDSYFRNSSTSLGWEDMSTGYCTVDIYNMTEGYPGVVDATFKYWNDWSRYERRYDYTRCLNDPINGRGCDMMLIPFCVYYDDAATFKIVETDKYGNVNTYTYQTPETPFVMCGETFTDTKTADFMQDNEVVFRYEMNHCGKGAFLYRNRFGGWDSFLIEGNISKTDNYTKQNWRRNGEYNQEYSVDVLKYFDEKITDSVNIDSTYEAYTGWLTDEESERLVFHLLSSPKVYFQNLDKYNQLFDTDPNFNLLPVRITASSAEYKKFRNGKRLVNYLITFEKGNIEKVRN